MITGVRARGAAAPQTRAKAKLFGQKPAAKNEKIVFIERKKRNSFCLVK